MSWKSSYDVVQVDASKPIELGSVDALLAVQPSSLAPEQMDNFVAAVKQGLPTVIFEDPAPLMSGGVPATSAPRRPPGGPMSMMMRSAGHRLRAIFPNCGRCSGIDFPADQVIWQDFNPYPKVSQFNKLKEYVFIDAALGEEKVFGPSDPISSGLQQVLLPFPRSVPEVERFQFGARTSCRDR